MEVLNEGCSLDLLVPAATVSCSSVTAYHVGVTALFFLSESHSLLLVLGLDQTHLRKVSAELLTLVLKTPSSRLLSGLPFYVFNSSRIKLFTPTFTSTSSILHVYIHAHVHFHFFNSSRLCSRSILHVYIQQIQSMF